MSKSYKTFSDWLNDQSESVQKRMEMISGALAWDQALLHSEHVKQLEASHRIKIENGNQPVNEQLLVLVKSLGHKAGCTRNAFSSECSCGVDAAIAAAEQSATTERPTVARSLFNLYHQAHLLIVRLGSKLETGQTAQEAQKSMELIEAHNQAYSEMWCNYVYGSTLSPAVQMQSLGRVKRDWSVNPALTDLVAAPVVKQQPPASEPVAYAVFTDQGNIQIWSAKPEHRIKEIADAQGKQMMPLYTTPQPAVPDNLEKLLNQVVPRIDAGGPNPIDEEKHCCEWTLHQERERIHSEFAKYISNQPVPAVPDGFALDAARYRWLRDKADYMRIPEGSPQVVLTDEFGSIVSISPWAYLHGDKLDEAIDGLLAAAKGE